jgi:hypothetical protein
MTDMQGYDGWTDDPTTYDDPLGGDELASLDGPGILDGADSLPDYDASGADGVEGMGWVDTASDGADVGGVDVRGVDVGGVDGLPAELSVDEPRFGAALSTAGTTADSYGEDYYWSTTENSYIGAQTKRPIDEWTETEAT